jgi:hypothetical protein
MAVISSNNASITIIAQNFPLPIVVENFDPESDMLKFEDTQTADAEKTPDGKVNVWSINALITCTLNLSGGAWESTAKRLSLLLNNQQRFGSVLSFVPNVTMIVDYGNGTIKTFPNGVMTSGSPAASLGNQKMTPTAWQFKFGEVI